MWEWSADRFAADGPERAVRGGSHLCHDSYGNRHHVAARTRTRTTPNSSAGDIGSAWRPTSTPRSRAGQIRRIRAHIRDPGTEGGADTVRRDRSWDQTTSGHRPCGRDARNFR